MFTEEKLLLEPDESGPSMSTATSSTPQDMSFPEVLNDSALLDEVHFSSREDIPETPFKGPVLSADRQMISQSSTSSCVRYGLQPCERPMLNKSSAGRINEDVLMTQSL